MIHFCRGEGGGNDAWDGRGERVVFSHVDIEERIPPRHPRHKIRQVVNDALASLDAELECLYADFGQPSTAPGRLIRASLIQIVFSVRVTPEACLRHDAVADGADAI